MSDNFGKPSSSAGIEWKNLLGSLVIVKVHEVIAAMKTVHGEGSAVRADVIVLDDKGADAKAGTEYIDTLIFPKVLQSQVKSQVGGMVLGRVGQGVAKPSQSAPWTFNEATEADAVVARAYLQEKSPTPF
ncbi:hypothetical protein [Kribbella sp. CA-293567]|uniref:hypothetical protein n=1 Tax=Kribbella sp. CA-293567 TaxID=3002436 RepID=UPI0022DDBF9C|nr:hypothetical protein [Kribbella sp. CA-293567]WBQ03801.1 hypothetical protein OX958_28005 [Kribbella sp. CA-293567]